MPIFKSPLGPIIRSPRFNALRNVLDYLRAMRTATVIPAGEAMEYAKLEEEFTTRLSEAQSTHER
jgi:hypothetical protein